MTNDKKVLKKEQKTLETLLKDNLDNSEIILYIFSADLAFVNTNNIFLFDISYCS